MKKLNIPTKIFQNYIKDKDIRTFKKNIFYFFFYRLLRNFFNHSLVVKIQNFYVLSSHKKNKASYSLIQKCDFFDVAEIQLIKRVSKTNQICFVDCGSNFGFYSLFVMSLSPNNRVISIEASAKTNQEFKENLLLNNFKNIKNINLAVSDKDNDIVELKESEKDWESSIIELDYNVKNLSKVKTIKIDTILSKENLDGKKLIFKIDVEGSDLNVLAGAEKSIKLFKPLIIIEFSKYILNNKEFDYNYLDTFLKVNDYKIYDNYGKNIKLYDILSRLDKLDKYHKTIGNYYLVGIESDLNFIKK